jgi:hypothetical protein
MVRRPTRTRGKDVQILGSSIVSRRGRYVCGNEIKFCCDYEQATASSRSGDDARHWGMFKFLGQVSSLAEDDTFVGMKLNFVAIINRLTHRPETETMPDNEGIRYF